MESVCGIRDILSTDVEEDVKRDDELHGAVITTADGVRVDKRVVAYLSLVIRAAEAHRLQATADALVR